MLKKYLIFIPLVAFIAYHYSGCDSDTINTTTNNPPMFGGYDQVEAGKMMTLSALCYTAEGSTNAMHIRDSINLQLANTNYATGGNWHLVWGPGLSLSGGNLMYVARDTATGSDTVYYAICVRGTIFSVADIEEDFDVFYLTPWTYGLAGDSVAYGSLEGFDTLLSTMDPVTNQTLNTFLNGANNGRQKMFITGHSLGGAMATLMTYWFVQSGFTNRFKLETYTFASPTVGNVTFAANFNSRLLSVGAENHRCLNTKDVVPYFWADLPAILSNNIPDSVPPLIYAVIQTLHQYMEDSIIYKHVETRQPLGSFDPVGCGQSGQYGTYICWVEFEHGSATYLRLLGADTINWGTFR